MSAAATRASTRKNAVCTSQPTRLKPQRRFSSQARAAHAPAAFQLMPSNVSDRPVTCAPGALVELTAEEDERRVGRRQVTADDRVGTELTSPPKATTDFCRRSR